MRKFSISRQRTGDSVYVPGPLGGITTNIEVDSEGQLDPNELRSLHEKEQGKINLVDSQLSVGLVGQGMNSKDRLRCFRDILEKYDVMSDDHVGHSLGGVLRGYHCGALKYGSPKEEAGVCDVAELWRYLVIDACLNTPNRAASKLLGWARGAPVGFETHVLIGGIQPSDNIVTANGITVERLPEKSTDLKYRLPVTAGFRPSDYLGKTILRIPCTIGPGLWKPRKVTTSWEKTVDITSTWRLGNRSIEELCSALSVICRVAVDAPLIWMEYGHLAHFGELHGSSISGSRKPLPHNRNRIEITREMLQEAIRFFTSTRRELVDPEVQIAIKHLITSNSQEVELVEKLIHLRIALEALYLDQGNFGELRFRLATHGAWYTARNRKERQAYFDSLKGVYDIASQAIHTGRIKHESKAQKLLNESQEICRSAIKKRVKSKSKPNWREITFGSS